MEHGPRQRRPRYPGRYPRQPEHRYKELAQDPQTVAKVLASGKTPTGTHVPVMVEEVLEALSPRPGDIAVDGTLGHGGHARRILQRIAPRGRLLALDADPLEIARTEAALRAEGHGPEALTVQQSNFAGLPAALRACGLEAADIVLVDLGVSSMQLDLPDRGFSWKFAGPLDMRMNPERGISAARWLQKISPDKLARVLEANSDEPHAAAVAGAIAGQAFALTTDLAAAVRAALPQGPEADRETSVRRVFQAIRVEVNGEFSALDAFLRALPTCLRSGGRAAILTFHSGEDRRVKHAFRDGERAGVYRESAREVIRAGAEERRANPRASSAKLRWAIRA